MLFKKRYFFCFCFHLFLESRTSSTHPQFATAYFLSWMPCYRCKQRITIIGLQTYSNILIEGILLKMLRNKSDFILCGQYILLFSRRPKFNCVRSKKIYSLLSCLNCFTWEMGSESKENHLSCLFIHPSSVYEKLQLQLYGGTSIENTFKYIASWLLCDFLNPKYEANL